MAFLNKYNLQNVENYLTILEDSIININLKFVKLIFNYTKIFCDNMKNNKIYYNKFFYNKGIKVISIVFKLLLLYTNNLELTFKNCEKSIIYYIEFMGQINDDNNLFLKLNVKDACIFIYKKTIFEIENTNRINVLNNNNFNNKIIIELSDVFIDLCNGIIEKVIDIISIDNILNYINNDFNIIINKIIKLNLDNTNENLLKKTS